MNSSQFSSDTSGKHHSADITITRLGLNHLDALAFEAATAIEQVFQYYRLTYENTAEFQAFVASSPRIPSKFALASIIGVSDRTLGKQIPLARTVSGGATRGMLKRTGLLTTTGGEYFRGCVVFAHRDANDCIASAVGVRYGARIRSHEKMILNWQLPNPFEYKQSALARAKEYFYE